MSPRRLVQIASGFARHDAISTEMRLLAEYVRGGHARPFTSALLLAEHLPPDLQRECGRLDEYQPRAGDVVLIHYSMALDDLERLLGLDVPLCLVYHNITPPAFYRPYDALTTGRLLRARDELPRLLKACRGVFAVSECNARELHAAGMDDVRIKPVLARIQFAAPEHSRREEEPGRLLFVGRFAPNKNHLDLIKIAALLKSRLPVRLTLAGGYDEHLRAYRQELERAARDLGAADVVEFLPGPDAGTLARLYAESRLFVCSSLHEGFCVPLLEAMSAGLPVLALHAEETAVAETMDGAGVGFRRPRNSRELLLLAETCALLLTDEGLRERVVAGQHRRMTRYRPGEIMARFFADLVSMLSKPGTSRA